MIKDINDLILLQGVKDFIERQGAEGFLKSLTYMYPMASQALSQAILADHAHDYDKKKAALLKKNAGQV